MADEYSAIATIAALELAVITFIASGYWDEAIRGLKEGHDELKRKAESLFRVCAAGMAVACIAIGLPLWLRTPMVLLISKIVVTFLLVAVLYCCIRYALRRYFIPWDKPPQR